MPLGISEGVAEIHCRNLQQRPTRRRAALLHCSGPSKVIGSTVALLMLHREEEDVETPVDAEQVGLFDLYCKNGAYLFRSATLMRRL